MILMRFLFWIKCLYGEKGLNILGISLFTGTGTFIMQTLPLIQWVSYFMVILTSSVALYKAFKHEKVKE